MNNISAGIVTYNPEMDLLRKNVEAVTTQVSEVIIFDNGSKNFYEIQELSGKNVVILHSNENRGIAHALNCIMKYSMERGYEWTLTLDQDSVCSQSFVNALMAYKQENVGIIAPVIVDRNLGVVGHNPIDEYQEVNTCITSGSINNIAVWKIVNGYDEKMFIDSVDFDYCYTLREYGYKIIQVRDVSLEHKVGDGQMRRILFWKVYVYNHSAFRKYYIARNNVYVHRKHKNILKFFRGNLRNLKLLLLVLIYENDKSAKIKRIISGWIDGYKQIV